MKRYANASHGKTKMGKMVRRRELPSIRRSRSLYRKRAVSWILETLMEREKVMKKGRMNEEKTGEEIDTCRIPPPAEFEILVVDQLFEEWSKSTFHAILLPPSSRHGII
jgi:hypothetical protein